MMHVVRMAIDLLYAGCYIFLAHIGYDIVDKYREGRTDIDIYVISWFIATVIMFFLTKQRYDKEVEEGKSEDPN